jgi:hypothetical protein
MMVELARLVGEVLLTMCGAQHLTEKAMAIGASGPQPTRRCRAVTGMESCR